MKSYTDIEQSKKLAGFLPLESADMNYYCSKENNRLISQCPFVRSFKETNTFIYIYCWSLTALLNVIPEPDLVQNSEGTWLVHSWVNAYPWSVGGYSNPVDAAYNMIIKLHERNLL